MLAAVPAAADSPVTSQLNVGAQLLRQPVGRPWAIALLLGATFVTSDGTPASPVRSMAIRFPHATVNDGHFPICSAARLTAEGPNGCAAGSQIGTGTAVADARPLVPFAIPAKLTVFNGPKVGKARHLSILVITQKLDITLVLDGVLRHAKGRYGYALSLPVPRLPTLTGSRDAGIASFQVKIKAFHNGISYLEAPRSCPSGGLPFDGTFGFADGQSKHNASAISCTLTGTPVGG
jgi:hypothetical protein